MIHFVHILRVFRLNPILVYLNNSGSIVWSTRSIVIILIITLDEQAQIYGKTAVLGCQYKDK